MAKTCSLGSTHWAATLNRTTNAVPFFPYLPSHDGFKAYGKQHFNISSLAVLCCSICSIAESHNQKQFIGTKMMTNPTKTNGVYVNKCKHTITRSGINYSSTLHAHTRMHRLPKQSNQDLQVDLTFFHLLSSQQRLCTFMRVWTTAVWRCSEWLWWRRRKQ